MNLNKKTLLLLLVFSWIAVIFYRIIFPQTQEHTPLKFVKGETIAVNKNGKEIKQEWHVNLVALEKSSEVTLINSKDIFSPIKIYTPPLIKEVEMPPVQIIPPPPVVPEIKPPTQEDIEAENIKQEIKQFKYLGYINKKGGDQVFLSKGQELFIVKKGEKIQKEFYLKDINKNSIIINEKVTNQETTLSLAGNTGN